MHSVLTPVVAVTIALAPTLLPAQSLSRGELILGNTATFTTAAPGSLLAVVALSTNGTVVGPCVPGLGCLDLAEPWLLGPLLVPDAQGAAQFGFELPATLPPGPLAAQAVVVMPTALALTNAVPGTMQPLSAFDDDFSGSSLGAGWSLHNGALLQFVVAGGELNLRPLFGGPAVTWYAEGEGPLLFRTVRGDFTVTAQLRSYRLSNPLLPPPANYDMGGLSLRDPASDNGPADWLHVAVGGGVPGTPIVVEDKSTNDGVSDLVLHPIAAPSGQIRATRQGATITLYHRPNGTSPWQLLRSHLRPDLGPELQVGPIVFSWSPTVDVGASFDWITFTRP